MHDFERDVAEQRLAHGFVYDPHAARAEVAKDPVIAQLLKDVAVCRRCRRGEDTGDILPHRLALLDQGQRREQLADIVSQLGVTIDVLGNRRVLAVPKPVGELLGDPLKRIAVDARSTHGSTPSLSEFTVYPAVSPNRRSSLAWRRGSP